MNSFFSLGIEDDEISIASSISLSPFLDEPTGDPTPAPMPSNELVPIAGGSTDEDAHATEDAAMIDSGLTGNKREKEHEPGESDDDDDGGSSCRKKKARSSLQAALLNAANNANNEAWTLPPLMNGQPEVWAGEMETIDLAPSTKDDK